jgi:hypothetical protein
MLQWETADLDAPYPFERYRAISGKHEFRIFYGPKAGREGLPWILGIRELRDNGVYRYFPLIDYPSDDDAKRGAERWKGPPPR